MEVAEFIDLPQFRHGLRTLPCNLIQKLISLLNICFVLTVTCKFSINETKSESITSIRLLSSHSFLIVRFCLIQIHWDQSSLFISLAQEGTGLRIPTICLLMINIEALDYILLSIDSKEKLVSVMKTVRFSPSVTDYLLNDLLIDRLLNFNDL